MRFRLLGAKEGTQSLGENFFFRVRKFLKIDCSHIQTIHAGDVCVASAAPETRLRDTYLAISMAATTREAGKGKDNPRISLPTGIRIGVSTIFGKRMILNLNSARSCNGIRERVMLLACCAPLPIPHSRIRRSMWHLIAQHCPAPTRGRGREPRKSYPGTQIIFAHSTKMRKNCAKHTNQVHVLYSTEHLPGLLRVDGLEGEGSVCANRALTRANARLKRQCIDFRIIMAAVDFRKFSGSKKS